MNLGTLENRLRVLIRIEPMKNSSQQFAHQHNNSSSSTSTMIPTPGMPQSGNSSLMLASSVDSSMIAAGGSNSIASSAANVGSFLPTGSTIAGGVQGGSFNSSDGTPKILLLLKCIIVLISPAIYYNRKIFQGCCRMDISSHLLHFRLVLVAVSWVLQSADRELQAK